jgi:hypothetical protein
MYNDYEMSNPCSFRDIKTAKCRRDRARSRRVTRPVKRFGPGVRHGCLDLLRTSSPFTHRSKSDGAKIPRPREEEEKIMRTMDKAEEEEDQDEKDEAEVKNATTRRCTRKKTKKRRAKRRRGSWKTTRGTTMRR